MDGCDCCDACDRRTFMEILRVALGEDWPSVCLPQRAESISISGRKQSLLRLGTNGTFPDFWRSGRVLPRPATLRASLGYLAVKVVPWALEKDRPAYAVPGFESPSSASSRLGKMRNSPSVLVTSSRLMMRAFTPLSAMRRPALCPET